MENLTLIKPEKVQNIINKFCYTIGMIPTSYKMSLTYEEQIIAIGHYLEETVIPALNNNAEAVAELQNLFLDLKNYVDNYFKNLDLQEEVNEKLNEMVTNGTFDNIINELLLKTQIFSFNNVTEMKESTELVNGNKIQTFGFYEKNDGGAGKYIVTDELLEANEIDIISLQNNLFAVFVPDNTLSVLQLGAKANNEYNNTAIFERARILSKNIIIPNGIYLLDYVSFNDNTIVNGCGSTLNLILPPSSPLCAFRDNSIIRNLTFNCLNEDREWNRIDMSTRNNINIENCVITGFRHNSNTPNAWGLYTKNSKNIKIINCKFDNNTQSDIALTEGTENILIENCTPLNNYFKINLEPQGIIKNVTLNNNNISYLSLVSNDVTKWAMQNIILNNNIIDLLYCNGVIGEFNNNTIKDIELITINLFSNIIKNNNTFGYSKQLNDDIFLNNIQNTNAEDKKISWSVGYTNKSKCINRLTSIEKGKYLSLNFENNEGTVAQINREFDVLPNDILYIDTLMNTKYIENSPNSGRGLNIEYYNTENTLIETKNCIIDRTSNLVNNESPWINKQMIIKIPEGIVKIRIKLSNFTGSAGTFCTNWGYLKLYKISLDNKNKLLEENISKSNTIPNNINNVFSDNVNLIGDKIYLKDNNNFVAICTESGNPRNVENSSISIKREEISYLYSK